VVTDQSQVKATVAYRCTASIGVVLFVGDDISQRNILKWADTAMYQAKDAGRNLICFHQPND
jgi:diguanylate cyclase (GGDEF)-like protein